MLEKLIKRAFISFYEDKNLYALIEIKKNKKTLSQERLEFKEKEELEKKILEIIEDYPQTYTSTIIDTINQGVAPSCSKRYFKDKEIEVENIKIVCIKNYSFYVSIYELLNFQKEFKFDIDFIYSIFAPIDYVAKKRHNYFYMMLLDSKIVFLAYYNNLPIYFDLEIISEEESEDDVEILDDIDILDDLSEDIEEESENLDLEEPMEKSSKEEDILNFLKEAIKDYYENYSSDFLEKIVILDTINIQNNIKKIIEDELFIDTEIKKFDLLKILNNLSEENV